MAEQNNGKKYYKKKTIKNNYAVQPMMVPIYPQPMIYPNQYVAQPQPMYQLMPQTYGMMQPVIPQATPNPIVAVPVGPPITIAQPVGAPILMPVATTPTPTQKIIAKPIKKAPKKKAPNILVKKYQKPQQDDCCNVF